MLPLIQFGQSCQKSDNYPNNLSKPGVQSHNLEGYHSRLDARESELFSPEAEGVLRLWEYDDEKQEFKEQWINGVEQLSRRLSGDSKFDIHDPICRFMFVVAPHSRASLEVSRKMMMYALTYHQVMPEFLDFLFPFGQQIYPQDFFFSGFRHENWISETDSGPCLLNLRRSGREFRMCYSLKSVEKVSDKGLDELHEPWSVRQTATYHSFDIETGVALWISVKGNDEIQDRMMSRTEKFTSDQNQFSTKARAFQESLEIHLINCKWAGEEWRWYLNFLEEELQGNTRRMLSARVVRGRKPEQEETWRFLRTRERTMSMKTVKGNPSTTYLRPQAAILHPAPGKRIRSISRESRFDSAGQNHFTFNDLQHVQSLEDKVNEVILVLSTNAKVLEELKEHYENLTTCGENGKDFSDLNRNSVSRFGKQITTLIRELQIHISRAGTLVSTLGNRKALLYGILNHQSTVANNLFASKAQQSADNTEQMTRNMETLTKEMNQLAKKATQETVSMRIITGVTLFFLPGTFFSTIMSTDIVQFQDSTAGGSPRVFRREALYLWLYVSIPLMVLTFAAWVIIYKVEKWQASKRAMAKATDEEKGRV